jgi:hypothetical protein
MAEDEFTHYMGLDWEGGVEGLRKYYAGQTKCFGIKIINKNTIEIYAYKNGRTYTLYRE